MKFRILAEKRGDGTIFYYAQRRYLFFFWKYLIDYEGKERKDPYDLTVIVRVGFADYQMALDQIEFYKSKLKRSVKIKTEVVYYARM